ncbi:hypothetical protein NDA14_006219 [Ustilago hordei]|uniref:DUF453-domain-containing protein n=1 Tax=Ustilago hordei TaxID=120017 RepID=I2FQ11_USTHO|nr:uncharacterized protein UHO2_06361 [Ustilago hordei]KAJ1604225.1 hypothetical protein NDA14_006219 [Ustilago hordei]CCF49004.1 uncharacterized protein UHOR_08599 [Ustilago hordei]SYW80899.1 uncharacterized protein UHO2_06361 [Ustilago hordei]
MLPTLALGNCMPGAFRLPCSFYRGGTSKGLLWSTSTLSPYPPAARDKLICRAMGSPDPDKRQIDGLGGGISSVSKTAIVGPPNSALASQLAAKGISFKDGIDFADDQRLAADKEKGWDLVYRFGQVPVQKGTQIDWTSTCGNLVSAVALFGLHQGHVPQSRIGAVFEQKQARPAKVGDKFSFPVRLMVTSSGQIIRANVPVTLHSNSQGSIWYPDLQGSTTISGVPGTAPGILIETPLDTCSLLPTGNQLDTLHLNGTSFPVTIINAGLPTIFISSSSIPNTVLDPVQLAALSPSDLDANRPLMTLLEDLRQASATLSPFLGKTMSPSAPKICIVHPKPKEGYTTTGGDRVEEGEMHLLIRAVSVGNLHRTVPATCLSALAVGRALRESTIEKAVQAGASGASGASGVRGKKGEAEQGEGILSITVGQPAGVSEASVKTRAATQQDKSKGLQVVPESIVYYRTARRIMDGCVDLAHSLVSS